MAGVFEALGDPTRRQLLELLSDGEHPVGSLVDALQMYGAISQPAVSQHLKTLREALLVNVRVEGTRRFYALDRGGLDLAAAWLSELAEPSGPLAQRLDALATEVARSRRARRTTASDPPFGSTGTVDSRLA